MLPVKVLINENVRLAHTIDITDVGARLGGLGMQLQPAMIISLQRGSNKAKFCVAWIRKIAPNELQVGVESVEKLNNFWGMDLFDQDKVAQSS